MAYSEYQNALSQYQRSMVGGSYANVVNWGQQFMNHHRG